MHGVSPQAVRTQMTQDAEDTLAVAGQPLTPSDVAGAHERDRVADRDRWLAAMTRLCRRLPSLRSDHKTIQENP